MANDKVHFQPFNDNYNVKCLNGAYHRRDTTDPKRVTCEACMKNDTDNFWHRHEEKNGNVHKNSAKGLRPFLQSTFKLFSQNKR
jgi:hypothetical protein